MLNSRFRRCLLGLCLLLIISCDESRVANISYTVDIEDLAGHRLRNKIVDTLFITRISKSDSVSVIFPEGGTQTDVMLVSRNDYSNWKMGKDSIFPDAIKEDGVFSGDGNEQGPKLDLTRIEDGYYAAYWGTCDFDGVIVVHVKTE